MPTNSAVHSETRTISVDAPPEAVLELVADPRTHGSEFLFTLFFGNGTDESAIARQMAIVEGELRTVRALCEG